jgi:hypothetical protein
MIQQITFLLPAPRWTVVQKIQKPMSWLFFLVLLLFASGARASTCEEVPYQYEKLAADSSISATICANEGYVFNEDTLHVAGQYTAVFTGSDGLDSTVTLDLSVLPILTGSSSAVICAGETYEFYGEALVETGTYEVVLTGSNGCDSIASLQLEVLESPATARSAAICKGSTYQFDGEALEESGTYTAIYDAENGCDSTVTLTLDVVNFFDTHLSATICAGETFVFGDTTLGLTGVYVDSLTALGGCDSIVTLDLHVLPVPTTHLETGICIGSEYVFQGETLTESGIYIAQLEAANGCDSLVVLDLTVADFFEVEIGATICAGETYTFGDETLDAEGVYVHELQAAGGCDSTVTVTLTVLPASTGAAEATICQGETLEYAGELLTEADVYEFVLTAENGCDSTVAFTLNVLPAPATALTATICAGETYEFNGATLNEDGVYVRVYEAENGCDSTVTLTLTVLPAMETEIDVILCAGESYEYEGETLDAEGSYPFTFAAENGCDSTVTIVVSVLPTSATEIHASICAGESYELGGDVLTESGEFTAVLTGENGCDSTVTLLLEVLPVQSSAIEAVICEGTPYYFVSDTLTESGIYNSVVTGENGCDSTIVLNLTVLPVVSTTLTAETCANEPYLYDGESIDMSGTYEFRFDGENGCDSIVILHLTVLPVPETTLAASICAGTTYEYDGDTLSAGGSYTYVFTAENGCDSIVILQLTLLPLSVSETTVTLCEGASYEFNGETITVSGTYTDTLTGENGCDSTAIVHLNFVPAFETAIEATVCAGETYDFHGESLTESGEYTAMLISGGGCDSIVTLTLTVLPTTESTSAATICAGETYSFNGEMLTEGGSYTAVLTGVNGCDSTAVLQLTVLPVVSTNLSATVCASEAYEFNGETLDESGIYTAALTGANGCDSTVTLTLTVLPESESSIAATICHGEVYEYQGVELFQSGTFTFVQEGSNGCDSTVSIHLTVLPVAEGAAAAVVCDGASYTFNGEELTESGTYTFTFPGASANGCDSLVTLFLNIFPAIPPTATEASICAGGTYDFYGTPLTVEGNYVAHLPSSTGCDSIINLTLSILPNITASVSATICAGETYEFHGQNLGAAGVYTASVAGTTGCDTIVTLTLSVNTINTTVTLSDGTLTAGATGATFQWFNCNGNVPVPGATESSFTPTVTGQYAVVITQGACTDVSDCQLVQVVGTNEPISAAAWTVQPNPAANRATVMLQEPLSSPVRVEIYDLAGHLLQQQSVSEGATQIALELSDMPVGVLLVRLTDAKGASTKRLVKTEVGF